MSGDYSEEKLSAISDAVDSWETTTLSQALARSPERKHPFLGHTDRVIRRLYTPLDVKDLDYANDLGLPGEYPFTRGVQATMYRGRLWTMRAQTGFGGGEETRERILKLMKAGEIGLSLDFDLPTILGLDPDDPLSRGEVGRTGLNVSCLDDFESLFDGIPLDRVNTSMTTNFPAPILFAMYLAVAELQGVAWEKLAGTLQFDLLKEYGAQNCYVFPPRAALRWWTDLVAFSVRHAPRFNPCSFWMMPQGRAYVSPGYCLGWAFSKDQTYLDAALRAGLGIDEFAPRISFLNSANIDFFESVAKLRAARRLWARIVREKYGAKDPNSCKFRVYYPGSADDLSASEPLNNIVRATIQVLASVLGGANAIDCGAYDEAYAIPSEQSALMKLRTQQIIAHESRVADVVDPLGGSYYVEALTSEIEADARGFMDEVERRGGFVACLEQGWFLQLSAQDAYRIQREKESGERVIVGENAFCLEDQGGEHPLELHETDPALEQRQTERVRQVRARRDGRRVGDLLARLGDAARGTDPMMPLVLEAVKARATCGEIMGVLKEVWGEYALSNVF
ncbi:MAG: methylmalonyl-CoA mutase [Deltaproteobacteria bacterium]|nr:methylmalonyl-CoA mutase [Deltaproteobacteria bacterium]